MISYAKKKDLVKRDISTNILGRTLGAPQAVVAICKFNKGYRNSPMSYINGKPRYAIAIPSQISDKHTDLLPFSSTQGPGDFNNLSKTFRDDGQRGQQNITEKLVLSDATKNDVEVLCAEKTVLPGVTQTTDPEICRRLRARAAVIIQRYTTEPGYKSGMDSALKRKPYIFVEDED